MNDNSIKRNKAIFVFENIAQATMFKSISKALDNWDILFIKSNKWNRENRLNEILVDSNFIIVEKLSYNCRKQLIIEENPDIIITGNDELPIERLFIKNANSLNIASLLVQEGFLSCWLDELDLRMNIWGAIKFYFYIPIRAIKLLFKRNHFKFANSIGILS